MGQYVEVVVELATPTTLTYSTTIENPQVGARVVVTVSRKRYNGVIIRVHNVKPSYRTISITEFIDNETTLVSRSDIELWEWVASYYITSLANVYKAAMPALIRNNSLNYSVQSYVEMQSKKHPDEILKILKRAPKQQQAFIRFIDLSQRYGKVRRGQMQEHVSAAILSELIKREILKIVQYDEELLPLTYPNVVMNDTERSIMEQITEKFATKNNLLLFEREPIDKLNIYIELIRRTAAQGKQTLILLPDGYTAEPLVDRLREYMGNGVVAYYPTLTDHRRAMCYIQSQKQAGVVVGARGAVFLPMESLGLIIVEQEQDYAYKNRDSSPRLNVRDVALVKAAKVGARVLLTSQAPSIESYFNATRGEWAIIQTPLNPNRIIEFKVLERGKELLSKYLRKRIEQTIERGEQALIFQNRRGFSIWVECEQCGEIPTCQHCNVSLTYHKADNTLRCHYCGYQRPYSTHCPQCSGEQMAFQGRGTERIEESLHNIFPEANIARLDYDSTRGKGAFEQIAATVTTSLCDIVVGTQMVVRGLNFHNISLVGIVNADNMLSQSDFRTSERAYALLTQLSNSISQPSGEVIIQTTKRLDTVIASVEKRDYKTFYENELSQRKELNYPPFVRMMTFSLEHKSRETLLQASRQFETLLRPTFGNRLSSPFEPIIDKKSDYYILEFMLRIERSRSVVAAKEIVKSAISSMNQALPSLIITTDVDPV